MNITEIQKLLGAIQNDPEIFEKKIEGWSIWNIVKEPISMRMISAVTRGKQDSIISKLRDKNIKLLLQLSRSIKANINWFLFAKLKLRKKTRPRIIIFVETIYHYKNAINKIRYPFGDDVISEEKQNYDVIFIERTKGLKKVKEAVVERDIKENFLVFPGSLELPFTMRKQKKKIGLYINELVGVLDKQITKMHDEKDLLFNVLKSKVVKRTLHNFIIEKKKAKKFFNQVNPRAICLTNSQVYQGTIAAAKEQGIKVIEFQHGVIDKDHPVYNYPSFLKEKKNQMLVPDQIFMWGDYWKEILLREEFWKEDELFSYGHSRISDLKLHDSQKSNEVKNKKIAKILYTSTLPLLSESISFFEKTLEIAHKKKLPLKITIKLHPGETDIAAQYFKLQNKFPLYCEIKIHGSADLYELIKLSDLHISVFSATLFESFELGVPTGVINLSAKDYFMHLCKKKYFKFFESPEELASISAEIVNQTEVWLNLLNQTKAKQNYFYSSNTAQYYCHHLNELVKN